MILEEDAETGAKLCPDAGAEEPGAEDAVTGDTGAADPDAEDAVTGDTGAADPDAEDAVTGDTGAVDPDAEEAGAELPVTEATGHTVVLTATMEVTT